jgi:G3E family GTPase
VRNDLLTAFRKLFANEAFYKLDWIIIETTGLADPAPIIQSFYMDKECQQKTRIDGLLTLVDAKHFPQHLSEYWKDPGKVSEQSTTAHGGIPEAVLQVLFADRILLNKVDLIEKQELDALKEEIKKLNSSASIFECTKAEVDIREVLNIRAFDPKRFLSTNFDNIKEKPILINRDASGKILPKKNTISFKNPPPRASLASSQIGTFSMLSDTPLDLEKFNTWIAGILQDKGEDIYRMKGILNISGFNEKFVCHGIHMIFDGERGPEWKPDEERLSRLVFIGKNLSKEDLEAGFQSTLI